MTEPRLYLFDDRTARRWAPFTLTRPAGELLYGCMTLRERAERVLGMKCHGHLSRKALLGFDEPDGAPTVSLDDVPVDAPRVLLSSRCALDFQELQLPDVEAQILVEGHTAGWVLPPGAPLPSELWLRDPIAAPPAGETVLLGGARLGRPWDLVARTPERISADITALWSEDHETPGAHRIGEGTVSLGDGASVEPGVHLDLRDGPVRLADGARIEGPARVTGPLYVGPNTTLLGGVIGTSSFGPHCKVRGEVADCIFLGYVNKAHDGHMGHAILGRWVNLGAFTTNSDLKNNYKPVRVWTPEGEVDTGLLKVGCFMGDHVKSGIGTLLNTGTVVGAGSNIFGGLMPPTVVPPFSWGAGADLRDHRFTKFIETAQAAMARRGQELTPGVARILDQAWQRTAGRRTE